MNALYYEPYSDSNPNGYSDSDRAVREHRMLEGQLIL